MRLNQQSAIGIQHFPTGQLQVEEGVYSYGARFYDSALGRFVSADTLIPQPGSPLAWDRYAYANGNPIRYNDPSGHMADEGCGIGQKECLLTSIKRTSSTITESDSHPQSILEYWMWKNIPSAFGFHLGVSGQIGIFIEPGITLGELLLLFNLKSGEITAFYSYGGNLYAGSPSLIGGSFYGGDTVVYGLSQNANYIGHSVNGGVVGKADSILQAGISVVGGRAITSESAVKGEIPPVYFVDPGSMRTVDTHQLSLSVGANGLPNAMDMGVTAGTNQTMEILTYRLPFWPLRYVQ